MIGYFLTGIVDFVRHSSETSAIGGGNSNNQKVREPIKDIA